MDVKKGDLVLPGDELAIAEEFAPGDWTYEHAGKVYASVLGRVVMDEKDRTVHVKPKNEMALLKDGDTVICKIKVLKSAMAIVEIIKIVGVNKEMAIMDEGAIHISKISRDYVKSIEEEFDPMDIIRARVMQAKPSIQLHTVEEDLGVIHAKCGACGADLERQGLKLYCSFCDRQERRKISTFYGEGEGEVKRKT